MKKEKKSNNRKEIKRLKRRNKLRHQKCKDKKEIYQIQDFDKKGDCEIIYTYIEDSKFSKSSLLPQNLQGSIWDIIYKATLDLENKDNMRLFANICIFLQSKEGKVEASTSDVGSWCKSYINHIRNENLRRKNIIKFDLPTVEVLCNSETELDIKGFIQALKAKGVSDEDLKEIANPLMLQNLMTAFAAR